MLIGTMKDISRLFQIDINYCKLLWALGIPPKYLSLVNNDSEFGFDR